VQSARDVVARLDDPEAPAAPSRVLRRRGLLEEARDAEPGPPEGSPPATTTFLLEEEVFFRALTESGFCSTRTGTRVVRARTFALRPRARLPGETPSRRPAPPPAGLEGAREKTAVAIAALVRLAELDAALLGPRAQAAHRRGGREGAARADGQPHPGAPGGVTSARCARTSAGGRAAGGQRLLGLLRAPALEARPPDPPPPGSRRVPPLPPGGLRPVPAGRVGARVKPSFSRWSAARTRNR